MTGSFLDSVTLSLEKVLDLRSRQHELTVTNLANADTPGFKARRLDFARSLRRLLAGAGSGPMRTHGAHLGSGLETEPVIELREAPPWAGDGNSVDAQREVAVLTENQLMYTASVEMLNRRIGLLRYVVSEGR